MKCFLRQQFGVRKQSRSCKNLRKSSKTFLSKDKGYFLLFSVDKGYFLLLSVDKGYFLLFSVDKGYFLLFSVDKGYFLLFSVGQQFGNQTTMQQVLVSILFHTRHLFLVSLASARWFIATTCVFIPIIRIKFQLINY